MAAPATASFIGRQLRIAFRQPFNQKDTGRCAAQDLRGQAKDKKDKKLLFTQPSMASRRLCVNAFMNTACWWGNQLMK